MPPTSDPRHINLIGTANVDDPACGFGLWIITDSLLLTWSSSYSTKSLSTRIKWSRLSDLKNKVTSWNLFFWLFLHASKSQSFFPIWIIIVLIFYIWETSRNKLKSILLPNYSSELSLFEQIVLVIWYFLQIIFFSFTRTFFSHSRSQQFW